MFYHDFCLGFDKLPDPYSYHISQLTGASPKRIQELLIAQNPLLVERGGVLVIPTKELQQVMKKLG